MAIEKLKERIITGVSFEDMLIVESIINTQRKIHSYCDIGNLDNITLYIIGKEIEGIEYIKVFDRNTIVVEVLDTSYTRMRSLSTLEEWNTKFILCVTFNELGEYNICRCKLSDIPTMEFKKPKELTYGVTDGVSIEKINIMTQDIKGLEYRVLKEVVGYSFNKKTGQEKDINSLSCILVKYN